MMRPNLLPLCLALGLALVPVASPSAADLPVGIAANFQVPVKSLKALRFASTTRQQYDFSCGSAALATLLSYHYRYPISETTAFEAMWDSGDQVKIRREGFSLLDMQRFLGKIGFKADGFTVPLQTLFDNKLPAIVLIQEKGYNHFVVIKGGRDGRVLLGDPSSGTRAMTRERFEAIWPTRLLFVVHDAPAAPAFNTADDWRAAPRAPLAEGLDRSRIATFGLPKFGPGDF